MTLFPQRTDLIVAVIDATTPEAADEAADALVKALAPQTNVIRNISRPDGGEFFAREGVLFLSVDDLRRNMDQLIKAEPFLGTLALDPTLRGILGAISQSLEGVRLKKTTLEDIEPAVSGIADALEKVEQGQHPAFSWRRLISGRVPDPSDLRRFVNIQAVLNYSDLEPGGEATKAVRATIAKLGLTPDRGVRVRLTGSVPLSDEEFSTIADGAALNGMVTIAVVLLILWLALKQSRIILAVLINLAVGLSFTAAVGLAMVGALEPHLRRLRRAVHRPWRRFRHSVQRPIPRRAFRGSRSPRGSRNDRRPAWRGRCCWRRPRSRPLSTRSCRRPMWVCPSSD